MGQRQCLGLGLVGQRQGLGLGSVGQRWGLGVRLIGLRAGGLGVLMIGSTPWFGGFDDRVNAGGLGVLVLEGGTFLRVKSLIG